jgi:hypothetical protein
MSGHCETTKPEPTKAPACSRCQREAGLSGGVCAYCMAKATGPTGAGLPVWFSPPTEEETAELDRALTALRGQAVRDGWMGRRRDDRPLTFRKATRA